MATSILSRKRDLLYLAFFITHIPVMLCFDLTAYYPAPLQQPWMSVLRTWYFAKYGVRFFAGPPPPPWFSLFMLLELVFHLPLTLWAIPALLRNDPRIPLALLVFGLETSLSTLVCVAEMLSWGELTAAQKGVGGLGGTYGGYLVLSVFMSVDCYARLDRILSREKGIEPVSKKDL